MDLWLKRRFIYIDEYINTRLVPDRVKNFYDKESPYYRHSNDYYTHLLFFVTVWARNEFTPYITLEQEVSVLLYVKKHYEEKIIELIKQYGH